MGFIENTCFLEIAVVLIKALGLIIIKTGLVLLLTLDECMVIGLVVLIKEVIVDVIKVGSLLGLIIDAIKNLEGVDLADRNFMGCLG